MIRAASEGMAAFIVRLQQLTAPGWVLRLAALGFGLAAIALCWFTAFSFFAPALAGLALVSLLIALILPDSAAVTVSCLLLAVWWLISGAQAPIMVAAALALCLGGMHLTVSWTAVAPPHGEFGARVRRRMWVLGASYLAVVLVCSLLVIAIAVGVPGLPGGLVWMALAVAGTLGLIVWIRRPRLD